MPVGFWSWPFATMIREPVIGGKHGKAKRRAANKRARVQRRRSR